MSCLDSWLNKVCFKKAITASHWQLCAYLHTLFPPLNTADVLLYLLYETNIEDDEVWYLETIPFHYFVAVNTIGRGNQSNCQTLMYAELQWVRNMNTTWCQTICVKANITILQCQLPLLIRKPVFYNIILIIMLSTCSNKLYVPLGL